MKTLNECINITNNSKYFVKTTQDIDGHTITSFNYVDGTPIQDFETHNAFELRGLTFVNETAFPMLHKFWNLGEKNVSEIESSLTKKVKSIQEKDDGSLIGFLILPNNKVIAKTKMGFSNEFTDIANKWLLNDDNENKILSLFNQGILPLFECVSNNHTIVLEYDWEGLKLIQARNSNWDYLEVDQLQTIALDNKWVFEKPLTFTISELLTLKTSMADKEGFIVRFHDNSFVKIKTDWYFEKHASSEGIKRVNEILVGLFSNEDRTEEDFEKQFSVDILNEILTPLSITSLDELKLFLFKTGIEKDIQTYQKIFKHFLKEYSLFFNYTKENSLIKLTINNNIDDILPNLLPSEREKALNIQHIVNLYISNEVDNVTSILSSDLNHKETQQKYKGYENLGIVLRYLKKEWDVETIKSNIKELILKRTRNLKNAQNFINTLNK